MTEAKHTPGPWLQYGEHGLTVYTLHDNGFGYWKDGKRELVNRFSAHVDVCEHQGGSIEEASANARLIAAAPDMLDALKTAREYVARVDATMAFTTPNKRATAPDLQMIDAAVAASYHSRSPQRQGIQLPPS
jgi:hypothetical protein